MVFCTRIVFRNFWAIFSLTRRECRMKSLSACLLLSLYVTKRLFLSSKWGVRFSLILCMMKGDINTYQMVKTPSFDSLVRDLWCHIFAPDRHIHTHTHTHRYTLMHTHTHAHTHTHTHTYTHIRIYHIMDDGVAGLTLLAGKSKGAWPFDNHTHSTHTQIHKHTHTNIYRDTHTHTCIPTALPDLRNNNFFLLEFPTLAYTQPYTQTYIRARSGLKVFPLRKQMV